MTYQTATEFYELLRRYRALDPRSKVLEIGSLGGETLWHWIEGAGPGGTVISVDWRVPESDGRHSEHKYGQEVLWPQWAAEAGVNLTVYNADSRKAETIVEVKNTVAEVDFLFIDGGHDYATVKADYVNYVPLVRQGGLIALHDIQGIEDVARFWNEIKGMHACEEYCHPGGWGIGLFYAGGRPPLTIITACTRPENLTKILPGIQKCRDLFDVRWIIVHDGPLQLGGFPAWTEQKNHPAPSSVAGKAQINFALESIPCGWVWVLDDDNAVHPNFAPSLRKMLTLHPAAKAFIFAQCCGRGIRAVAPDLVRECSIDQAQFVLRRDLIGDHRYPLRYTGDGAFVEELHALDPKAFRYCADAVVFYNALRS